MEKKGNVYQDIIAEELSRLYTNQVRNEECSQGVDVKIITSKGNAEEIESFYRVTRNEEGVIEMETSEETGNWHPIWKDSVQKAIRQHCIHNNMIFTEKTVDLFPKLEKEDKFGPFELYPIGKKVRVELTNESYQYTDWKIDENTVINVSIIEESSSKEKDHAELHKFKLFVDYYQEIPHYSVIESKCVEMAFQSKEIKKYHGEAIKENLKSFFLGLCRPLHIKDIRKKRGLLLWGPPGTGKTTLEMLLAEKVGFTLLNDPFTGSEVKGGIVGDTEKKMKAIMERAKLTPWLPCCLIIDEIDTIAPNRLGTSDNVDSKAIDAMSVLLTVFGGARNVPNLFLFGATNRLTDMDPAFLRRMSGKFFVGLPSPNDRKSFLEGKIYLALNSNVKQSLVKMTTNFSGDQMQTLVSLMTEKALEMKIDFSPHTFSAKECEDIVMKVCRGESIFFGDTYLPLVLKHGAQHLETYKEFRELIPSNEYTGRIFINLKEKTFYLEKNFSENLHEIPRRASKYTKLSFNDAITLLTEFCIERNILFYQLITGGTLYRNKSTEEKESIEYVTKITNESLEYQRSMLIFDLDSMVNVDRQETNPDGGFQSISDHVLRPQLMHAIFNVTRTRALVDTTKGRQSWIVIILNDYTLEKKLLKQMDFPNPTRIKNESKKCTRCGKIFNSATRVGNCRFHSSNTVVFNDDKQSIAIESPENRPFFEKQKMVRICCGQPFLSKDSHERCEKGDHQG